MSETSLALPKDLKERLRSKFIERNDDLIMDYLEQIELHEVEIAKLKEKVNKLVTTSYLDDNTQRIKKGK